MKIEVTKAEAVELVKEIHRQPETLYEVICTGVKQGVGQYLSTLMDMELANFLGRGRYERLGGVRQITAMGPMSGALRLKE